MKEITVISGKGGTGKTTLVASFAALARSKVLADCDVDAPDLWLILKPKLIEQGEFRGSKAAVINRENCQECGRCNEVCRFEAIRDFEVDPIDCEGCGACLIVCPLDAISLEERAAGNWFTGTTDYGPMVYARLNAAEENSGKLVTLVRQKARHIAQKENLGLIITDGPSGIGCPVISSLTGTDLALIVTEPTMSGLHDLQRIVGVCRHFRVPAMVCINKYDLNLNMTQNIELYCRANSLPMTTKIPFDPIVSESIVQAVPLVAYSRGRASECVVSVWEQVQRAVMKNS